MLKSALKWAGRPLWNMLRGRIDLQVRQHMDSAGYVPRAEAPAPAPAPTPAPTPAPKAAHPLWVPPCPPMWEPHTPFMTYSTCSASDLMHAQYAEYCKLLNHPPIYHRKVWEWVYVIHQLKEAGVLTEGKRGVGFGVGTERLPALFAKLGADVVATDAPPEIGEERGWREDNQHSDAIEQLQYPDIVDAATFARKARHQSCDMNNISPDLRDFDFTWSCCCYEHLGSLEAGMQFVINSVEQTLKIGGVACHTTEFNLSSNDATVSEGGTVLYRRRDMEELVRRLRERGHHVKPFAVAPDSHYLDGFVDVPPYTHNPHLKLLLEGYVATSVGLVITRGK